MRPPAADPSGQDDGTCTDTTPVKTQEILPESGSPAAIAAPISGTAQDAITVRNQESPLLRLPAELRYRIWTYTLSLPVLRMGLTKKGVAKISDAHRVKKIVRATAVCRQIRAETRLLFFRLQTFRFGSGLLKQRMSGFGTFELWMERFGEEQRSAIRCIYVCQPQYLVGYKGEYWGPCFWNIVATLHGLEKFVLLTRGKVNRRTRKVCRHKLNRALRDKVELVIERDY
ncbi:hypothetical protein E8E13_009748 [Curvularia kusanoi]|uniref:F-box domain-containing protein n=1 Tax=Curvularia kusanoi TaxID=90978 RepID=A0A9P4TEG6_CURKU|nr:hypothetical protein E8E13_009748 [Curvularia kusanoi]